MGEPRYAELGFYALPGHALEPSDVFDEISSGDLLGLGSVWISERHNTKDIGVMSGIAAATTKNMGIASGLISQLPLRHPLVVAGYGSTMATITNQRFALGIGRGVDKIADKTGTPRVHFQLLADYINILRRLWRGEAVDYEGPAGVLKNVALGFELERVPPIIMAAMGSRTCHWAGQHCDGVVFNSLWTEKAISAAALQVRRGAEDAGRDPNAVRIWTVQVTACEVSEEDFLSSVVRRMNTYVLFPPMMSAVCEANGWDPAIVDRVRSKLVEIDGTQRAGIGGDENTSRDIEALRSIRRLYPDEWINDGNAVGTAHECARATRARLDAGADGVLFHGSPPNKLAPLLKLWPQYRLTGGVKHTSVNPGVAGRA